MRSQEEVLPSGLQGLRPQGPRKAVRVDVQKGTPTLHPRFCEEQTGMKPEPGHPAGVYSLLSSTPVLAFQALENRIPTREKGT